MDAERLERVRRKRIAINIGLILVSPFLLCTCVPLLLLVNTVNPLAVAFNSEFEVENRTSGPIWITPIGTTNQGSKAVLLQYTGRRLAIPSLHSTDLEVVPGRRVRIHYDWDDINFSDILVRDLAGNESVFVVDAAPPTRGYFQNQQPLYVIQTAELSPAPPQIVTARDRSGRYRWRSWTVMALGFIAPIVFLILLRARRRIRNVPAQA